MRRTVAWEASRKRRRRRGARGSRNGAPNAVPASLSISTAGIAALLQDDGNMSMLSCMAVVCRAATSAVPGDHISSNPCCPSWATSVSRCAALEAENRELDFRRALDVQGFVADISLVRKQQAATARRACTQALLCEHVRLLKCCPLLSRCLLPSCSSTTQSGPKA